MLTGCQLSGGRETGLMTSARRKCKASSPTRVNFDELEAEAGPKPPIAHADGQSAALGPSALVQGTNELGLEPSAMSAAAGSSAAVPGMEDAGSKLSPANALADDLGLHLEEALGPADVPDALVLDKQMQLLQHMVNQRLGNVIFPQTVAYIGRWVGNAKCVMTHKSIATKWRKYYGGICCLCQPNMSVDNLANGDSYSRAEGSHDECVCSPGEVRLAANIHFIKHILTSEELSILAFAILFVDLSPTD